MYLEKWLEGLSRLTIFHNLLDNPIIASLCRCLRSWGMRDCSSSAAAAALWCEFVSLLYQDGANLGDLICRLVLEDDNFYVRKRACSGEVPIEVEDCLKKELAFLQDMVQSEPGLVCQEYGKCFDCTPLPTWQSCSRTLIQEYAQRLTELEHCGYGMYSKYHMFHIRDGHIVPIAHPDLQSLSQLYGYERERQLVIENTRSLLQGRVANNVLLYGDAGTGKSSSIKAIANAYKEQGLRLIEIKKNQLWHLPDILEAIADNPLKFILFIDDLSFSEDDENYAALKAILEGSASVCSKNVAIYATSNRRHLVRETFAQRQGDQVHVNDTLQEMSSLSARFGLTITFQKPDRTQYLQLVQSLAKAYNLVLPEQKLFQQAEAFAIRKNGRSPRTAKQFITSLIAKE